MTSRSLTISLGACLLAVSTYVSAAEAEGWYIGTGIGFAKNKINNFDYPPDSTQKTNATGFKLYAGYQFSNHWATELEYVNLGKFSYDESDWHSSVHTSGLGMSMVGKLPLSEQFALLGKLGAFAKAAKVESYDASGSYSATEKTIRLSPLLGVGAEYQLTPNIALRAEYEYFGSTRMSEDNTKLSNDLLSMSVRYSF